MKAITAGVGLTVALKGDGTVIAWGNNDSGQCSKLNGLRDVKIIVSVDNFAIALKEDGTIIFFGGYMSFVIPNIQSSSTFTGYISPDLYELPEQTPLKEGFKVEVIGTDISTVTNPDGSFKISNIPRNSDGYTIRISKPGYLFREITESSNISIGSITLWAGDINQDNAINMTDVMEIAKAFNTTLNYENFNPNCDLNKDSAVNMGDVMILAKHFNQNSDGYLG